MTHPLKHYRYSLPEKNIRKEPLIDRDHSRLFVYDTSTDTITFDYFYNLAKYVPSCALMVLNNTAVIPARVTFRKDTGGKVGGLILMNEGFDDEGAIPVIVDEKIFPGRKLSLNNDKWFTITRQNEQRFYLKPEFDANQLPEILDSCGTTPTPFYLGKMTTQEDELRIRYQTVFARDKKSVAAPTASLHFTDNVFASLDSKGVKRVEVTLDVGLGTFAEVEEKHVQEKVLHYEKFYLSKETFAAIYNYKKESHPVVAVGTTVTRTLESTANTLLHGAPHDMTGETNIFIMPPYDFKVVDYLITNFHVPQSSLMALVDAFLLHKEAKKNILDLYEIAKKEGFMFYSFGDSMLIL
jgi:S-adenosylmethionine:tRNA ribosyltransferase-isomerase